MKRRAFSILEVLIAFSIIVMCGAALVMNFSRAHKEGKEKDVINIIESKLRMGAQLAKISGAEVRVVIGEENGVKEIYFEPDINVSARMKANLSRKTALPHLREVELSPNDRNDTTLFFFPWGVEDRETKLLLIFDSGNRTTLNPATYAPNVVVDDPKLIEDLFPHEILEDEKENTFVQHG